MAQKSACSLKKNKDKLFDLIIKPPQDAKFHFIGINAQI